MTNFPVLCTMEQSSWEIRITHTHFVWQIYFQAWWRHQMKTFSALLALCAGNSPVTAEFPSQRPVTRSFDVFFDLRLNKRLNKQWWGWWFETPSRSSWRHCNGHGLRNEERASVWLPHHVTLIDMTPFVSTYKIFWNYSLRQLLPQKH